MIENARALMTITADIVAAHVSNNSVAASDLPVLIAKVHEAFAALAIAAESAETESIVAQAPAVSVRSSVKPDALACLCCGQKMKMLKRHLMSEHQISVADYKAMWKLPSDYPTVAPNYAATRRTLALTIGLGRKPGQRNNKVK